MNLFEKIGWYYRNRGLKALFARIFKGRRPSPDQVLNGDVGATAVRSSSAPKRNNGAVSAYALLADRFISVQPMPIYTVPGVEKRLNLVTDSINAGSLFGGVGTAIILASVLATRRGAKLRVITRTEAPDEQGFMQVLECNNLTAPGNVEFVHLDVTDCKEQLAICEADRFLTTSWWTTASVLGSVSARKVDYLLQEDERMFYPYGDDWVRCNELLLRSDIRFVINTELLYRHLLASGLDHLEARAVWFEPAFPLPAIPNQVAKTAVGKRKLFFYARPNNLRNLFYRGLEVLDRAVVEGVIDPEKWEVLFVGNNVPKVWLGDRLEPTVLPPMGWRNYGEFISQVDAGFCLMATPHPSYPPLDLASAGAFVLTNKFGLKQNLRKYSDRIVCSELDTEALLEGMRTVIGLAQDGTKKLEEGDTRVSRSWKIALADVVEYLS